MMPAVRIAYHSPIYIYIFEPIDIDCVFSDLKLYLFFSDFLVNFDLLFLLISNDFPSRYSVTLKH